MDDLAGLDWTAPKSPPIQKPTTANYYPSSIRPTPPLSGRSTPSSQIPFNASKAPSNGPPRSNSSTPANDSFANLVSFKNAQPNKNLSLQEQQRILEDQKAKQYQGSNNALNTYIADGNGAFWDKLESGRTTPNNVTSPPGYAATDEYGGQRLSTTINKPFSGVGTISSQAKQIKAGLHEKGSKSAFGEVSNRLDGSDGGSKISSETQRTHLQLPAQNAQASDQNPAVDLDEDPFGLGMNNGRTPAQQQNSAGIGDDDEDVLGLLGRPVSEFQQKRSEDPQPTETANIDSSPQHDRAVAELVEMGFSPEKSREALESINSKTDVQAAVGWILDQAHQHSKEQSQQPEDGRQEYLPRNRTRRGSGSRSEAVTPAWMRQEAGTTQHQRRQNSRSPANNDKDPAKIAAELGNNLFKSANSLWKTGTKKLNQAVADFNSESGGNQPKWMRDTSVKTDSRRPRQLSREDGGQDHDRMANDSAQGPFAASNDANVTDEALMLESGDARPLRKPQSRPRSEAPDPSRGTSKGQAQAISNGAPKSNVPSTRVIQKPSGDPRTRLNRQVIDEQTSQAYVSPARRKKPASKPPAEPRAHSPEPDLLFDASQSKSHSSVDSAKRQPTSSTPHHAAPLPTRPPPPKRHIPPVSPSALQTWDQSRAEGTAAFKRGDYAGATMHYSTAHSALPPSHPLTIPILANRALAHSKTGDPKACIADATTALDLIGPSRGNSETIDIGDEGSKDLSLFWGKAMMRKAEALEQLERWTDAASAWKLCVEAGVGGATSIAGRNRCEKAAHPEIGKHAPAKRPAPKPKPKPRQSALDELSGRSTTENAQSTEAVNRLRAANLEAERVDDEKFALSDSVSERLQNWRAGKEGNLRALLASLENVLWDGAAWKKIGMGELILPGKVKVAYMKGIAKVHPDKVSAVVQSHFRLICIITAGLIHNLQLPPAASTEQKMISAAVFATLNEAWDGFKRENNL